MDDINLFIDLGAIKHEIEKDFRRIDKIANDLDLQAIYSSNQELSDKVYQMNQNCTKKIENFKSQSQKMEKEIVKLNTANINKDNEIQKLIQEINEIKKQNENCLKKLNEEENKNKQIQSELTLNNEYETLQKENFKYINSLFN